MEGMEGEALDVLGSVLLGYMDTVGTTISANVESSGRSSAHSNAYDALNAVELCTAPAATQLASSLSGSPPLLSIKTSSSAEEEDDESLRDRNRLKEAQDGGWEGLAAFLFGPNWFSIKLEGEEAAAKNGKATTSSTSTSSALASLLLGNKDGNNKVQSNGSTKTAIPPKKAPGGKTILPKRPNSAGGNNNNDSTKASPPPKSGKGKQLINMKASNDKSVSFSLTDRPQSAGDVGTSVTDPTAGGGGNSSSNTASATGGRWHAPHPNAIPPFPLVPNSIDDIANPHRLPGGGMKTSLSLHDLATEMEACREPAPSSSAKRPKKGSTSGSSGGNDQDGSGKATTASAKAARLKERMAEEAMKAALRMPDDVFSTIGTVWGSIQEGNKNDSSSNNKRKEGGPTAATDGKKETISKKSNTGGDTAGSKSGSSPKVTFDSSTKQSSNAGSSQQPHASSVAPASPAALALPPPHVPNFLPPYPTDRYSEMARDRISASLSASTVMGDVILRMHHREKRKAPPATAKEAEGQEKEKRKKTMSEVDAVRRSVIELGKSSVGSSHWGSKWLENDGDDRLKSKMNDSMSNVTVTPSSLPPTSSGETKKSGPNTSQVVPLGRASGTRVSKILEGSMNVS
mmetsp:Transcript_41924/g.88004  ORF Transcript_41924/g.88004 Transcript_41924/m.88004 type:complete len:629 (+) Transcript_41924:93-1979(+)